MNTGLGGNRGGVAFCLWRIAEEQQLDTTFKDKKSPARGKKGGGSSVCGTGFAKDGESNASSMCVWSPGGFWECGGKGKRPERWEGQERLSGTSLSPCLAVVLEF